MQNKQNKFDLGIPLAALLLASTIIHMSCGALVIAWMRLTYYVTYIKYDSLDLVWLFHVVTHNAKLRA